MGGQDDAVAVAGTTVRWVLLADSHRARLLRCGLNGSGRCRIEERGSIDNAWPGHEHARGAPRWKNATITFGMDEDEGEDRRRFARDVVAWLEERMKEFAIGHVHILASGRFLGALRKIRPACLARQHILERKADLMHLSLGKLAKHPVIRQLMAPAYGASAPSRGGE